jgi:cell division septum initiation protein DivIVA
MTVELYTDEGAAVPSAAAPPASGPERPNVAGDLPAVLGAAPMFRRAVAGYDRFEVDTYVRWAEDELAGAARELERLELRHLRTRAELDDARELLAHSPGGGELLMVSRRTGALLAAAADEAASIRAEAARERTAAAARARRMVARARQAVADAEAEARRLIVRATCEAEETAASAARLVAEARQIGEDSRREAAERRAEARAVEQRAYEEADRIRQDALAEAAASRLRARQEIVGMLGTSRDARRRADEQADADRDRLDRAAAARRAGLLAEVATLEDRRAALRAEVARLAAALPAPTGGRLGLRLRRLLDRAGRGSAFPRSLGTPH